MKSHAIYNAPDLRQFRVVFAAQLVVFAYLLWQNASLIFSRGHSAAHYAVLVFGFFLWASIPTLLLIEYRHRKDSSVKIDGDELMWVAANGKVLRRGKFTDLTKYQSKPYWGDHIVFVLDFSKPVCVASKRIVVCVDDSFAPEVSAWLSKAP